MLEVEVRVGESLVRMLAIRDVEDGTWAMKYMIMTYGSPDTMRGRATEIASRIVAFIEAPLEVRRIAEGPPEV